MPASFSDVSQERYRNTRANTRESGPIRIATKSAINVTHSTRRLTANRGRTNTFTFQS